jgi:hypothetical protein
MKLFNRLTGLYYVLGLGFNERCLNRATKLGPVATSVVKTRYANVGEVRGRLTRCACDECEAKRKARLAVCPSCGMPLEYYLPRGYHVQASGTVFRPARKKFISKK